MSIVHQGCHCVNDEPAQQLSKNGLHVTLKISERRMPPFIKPTNGSVQRPHILICRERNLFEEAKKGQFEMEHAYSEKMFGLQTKSIAKGNELPESSMKPLKRSNSFSGWKITDSEERKSVFMKFALFDKKRVKSNTICGLPEHGTEHNDDIKSRTFSCKTLSSSCLPLTRRVINRLTYSDCLDRSNQVIDSIVPHKIVPVQRPEKESYRRSWTTENVYTPASLTSSRDSQTTETKSRNSRILVTRFELELAINKDDSRKLLSTIQCKTVDLNEKDFFGKTLLHTASSVGNLRCGQILINNGADVNLQDHAGFTPLHCAVVSNHVPCAALLISSGADLMARTRTMHTALTLAHEDEMILLIGRSLLLRETLPCKHVVKDSHRSVFLRETNL